MRRLFASSFSRIAGPDFATAKHFDPRVQAQSSPLKLGTMTGETLVAENRNDVTNKLDSGAFRGFLSLSKHRSGLNMRAVSKSGIVRRPLLV